MGSYLFEIGAEEIPSSYIAPALEELEALFRARLTELRIEHGRIESFATPRRMALLAREIPERRALSETLITGPPFASRLSSTGEPSAAALGFARSKGAVFEDLIEVKTEKGSYLGLTLTEGGESSAELIGSAMERIVQTLKFPKSMRWGAFPFSYARPIHWIVSLFDSEPVDLTVGSIRSGSLSRAHRFLGSGSIEIKSATSYVESLKRGHVIPSIAERREKIRREAKALADAEGLELVDDDDLIESIAGLTEYPVALIGSIDERFLELPEEVLIATLKNHQRMIATRSRSGALSSRFIGVANIEVEDESTIVSGYERVARARLRDAFFFQSEDLKRPLEDRIADLDKIIYQKRLGSIGAKSRRVASLAVFLASRIAPDLRGKIERAAMLAKTDLTTSMVYEFPELEGIVGARYARIEGMDADLADAIEESYMPRHSGGRLPTSELGSLLAIAEKIETLTGSFSVGLTPTSAKDPFGLRRLALGAIEIILDRGISISISELIDVAIARLATDKIEISSPDELRDKVLDFLIGRLRSIWARESRSAALIADAVLAVGRDDLRDASARFEALSALEGRDFYEGLSRTFKRAANIVGSDGVSPTEPARVDRALFQSDAESKLHEAALALGSKVERLASERAYLSILEEVAGLGPYVDRLFDEVMVNVPDDRIRSNRLALLRMVIDPAHRVADFALLKFDSRAGSRPDPIETEE